LLFKDYKETLLDGLILDDTSWLTKETKLDYPVIFSLMLDYFEDRQAFSEEMQMIAQDKQNMIFKLQYFNFLPKDLSFYMGVDAAKTRGDFAAIAILGFSASLNKYFVVDGFIAKIHLDLISKKILSFAQKYYLQTTKFLFILIIPNLLQRACFL